MAVNFGQYEGHRILTNAMNNALNKVTAAKAYKDQIKQQEFKNQLAQEAHDADIAAHEDSLLTSALNREILEDNFLTDKKAENRESLIKDTENQLFEGMGGDTSPIKVIDGEITLVPDADKRIQNFMKRSDMGYIGDISDSLATANDYGSVEGLSYDEKLNLSNKSIDFAKTQLANMRKELAMKSTEEVEEFFANNKNAERLLRQYAIDIGAPVGQYQSLGNYIKGGDEESSEVKRMMDLGTGWGASRNQPSEQIEKQSGWGGGIFFSSNVDGNNATSTDIRRKNLLINAIKNMKNSNSNFRLGLDDRSDKMWIHQEGNEWTIEENDAMGNDKFTVEFDDSSSNAFITVDGKKINLNNLSDDWWDSEMQSPERK
tara:strand:+ start:4094 stop:5215 length:1122 start_codon:yes stop_codon:yes gene_type:complete